MMGNPATPAKETDEILQAASWNDATSLFLTARHVFDLLTGVQVVFDRIDQGTKDILRRYESHLLEMRTRCPSGSFSLPGAIAMQPDSLRQCVA